MVKSHDEVCWYKESKKLVHLCRAFKSNGHNILWWTVMWRRQHRRVWHIRHVLHVRDASYWHTQCMLEVHLIDTHNSNWLVAPKVFLQLWRACESKKHGGVAPRCGATRSVLPHDWFWLAELFYTQCRAIYEQSVQNLSLVRTDS